MRPQRPTQRLQLGHPRCPGAPCSPAVLRAVTVRHSARYYKRPGGLEPSPGSGSLACLGRWLVSVAPGTHGVQRDSAEREPGEAAGSGKGRLFCLSSPRAYRFSLSDACSPSTVPALVTRHRLCTAPLSFRAELCHCRGTKQRKPAQWSTCHGL
jgi:hypothetical protein